MADFEMLKDIRRRAFAALIPPPVVPLSRWIAVSVSFPEGLAAVPGPMRLYPHQREIADVIGDPDIERVTLQKAARIGFSALVVAAIGHFCSNHPSPILCGCAADLCGRFGVGDRFERHRWRIHAWHRPSRPAPRSRAAEASPAAQKALGARRPPASRYSRRCPPTACHSCSSARAGYLLLFGLGAGALVLALTVDLVVGVMAPREQEVS